MHKVSDDGGGLPNRLSSPVVRNSTGQRRCVDLQRVFRGRL